MELDRITGIIRACMPVLKEKYGVKRLGVFGSVVRGDYTDKSDVDVLVEYKETPDLFELVGLEEYLTRMVGRKVDLVPRRSVKPMLRESITKDVTYV